MRSESPSPSESVRGFRVSSMLLLCLFPGLFPAVRGGYRRCGLGLFVSGLFGILGGLVLIVQALRARSRTLRLGLNQLRVLFRVVHAQAETLSRALLRI